MSPEPSLTPAHRMHGGPPTRASRWETVVALLVYLAFDLILARPWLGSAGQSIPLDELPPDGWLILFILEHVFRSLTTDPSALLEFPIHWPAREQLVGSEHFVGWQLLYTPARLLGSSPFAAFNATLFLVHPLASLLAFLLLRRLGCDRWMAWLGGAFAAVVTFSPGCGARPHVLQMAPLAVLAVVLALRCLRDEPRPARALALALTLAAAAATSFYAALAVALVGIAWAALEWRRPVPGRRRFTLLAMLGALAAALPLLWLSRPWFAAGARLGMITELLPPAALAPNLQAADDPLHGGAAWVIASMARIPAAGGIPDSWPFLLGLAGLLTLRRGSTLRPLVTGGALLAILGTLFSLPPELQITETFSLPTPAKLFLTPAFRFARRYFMLQTVKGLGVVLLATAGFQSVALWLGGWASPLLLAAVVAGDLASQRICLPMAQMCTWSMPAPLAELAAAEHGPRPGVLQGTLTPQMILPEPAHELFRQRFRELLAENPGPVLELPRERFDRWNSPEAASWFVDLPAPNLLGHTGYPPPHAAWVLAEITAGLTQSGLDDLIAATGLRWLVLHPEEEWDHPRARSKLLDGLAKADTVRRSLEIGGFRVFELDTGRLRPEWLAALRQGYRPHHSLLGTPLEPVPTDQGGINVLVELPARIHPRWITNARVRIVSPLPLPAAHPNRGLEPLSVHLEFHWESLPDGLVVGPTKIVELPRDVAAAELWEREVALKTPPTPGKYRVVVDLVQVGTGRIGRGRSKEPLRLHAPSRRPPAASTVDPS